MRKMINAVLENVNIDDSTFDVILSFPFAHEKLLHVRIYCRVEGKSVKAYNVGIMDGTCPCCLKPTCYSLFASRQELFNEAQRFIELPRELFKENFSVLIN